MRIVFLFTHRNKTHRSCDYKITNLRNTETSRWQEIWVTRSLIVPSAGRDELPEGKNVEANGVS